MYSRSNGGPMDWSPAPSEDGPSRKRPHYDPSLHASSPFFNNSRQTIFPPSAANPSANFRPEQPFLFHTPPSLASTPQPQQHQQNFNFDPSAFNPITAFGLGSTVPEVEMGEGRGDVSVASISAGDLKDAAGEGGGVGGSETSGSVVGGGDKDTAEVVPRKVATGAVKREMRKREEASSSLRRKASRGSMRRNRREEEKGDRSEDSEGTEEGEESDPSTPPRPYSRRSRNQQSSRSSKPSSALARITSSSRKSSKPKEETHHYNLHLPGQTVSHGEIPYILLGYLQFFFNLSLVLILLYLAVQFILTVKADINRKVEEVSFEILQEIATCTSLYLTNHCEPDRRIPHMAQACTGWEHCMNRDPTVVGRAKVGAETFAGVVNSFVDPISWKTMGFTLVTLTFFTIVLNSALSFYRSSHRPASHPPTPPHQPQWLQPPPNMQHYLQAPPQQWQHQQQGGNAYGGEGTGSGGGGNETRDVEWRKDGEGKGEGDKEKEKKKKGWF